MQSITSCKYDSILFFSGMVAEIDCLNADGSDHSFRGRPHVAVRVAIEHKLRNTANNLGHVRHNLEGLVAVREHV